MEIFTPRLKLREFVKEDLAALRDMDRRAEMHAYEREVPGEAETLRSLEEYLQNQCEKPRTIYRFAITLPPNDSVKGLIKFSRQWEAIREWEIGWAVHPEEWRRGYAAEAARQVINTAFNEMNVHRIVAFCRADNLPSVRVMEKLGMQRDAKLRETRWLGGKWWDEYVYSVLEREWKG